MTEKKTLKGWRKTIKKEVPYVDTKQYSHNLISLALRAIDGEWGTEEANKAIKDFGLEALGWSKC